MFVRELIHDNFTSPRCLILDCKQIVLNQDHRDSNTFPCCRITISLERWIISRVGDIDEFASLDTENRHLLFKIESLLENAIESRDNFRGLLSDILSICMHKT
jgi:hypothetical protein